MPLIAWGIMGVASIFGVGWTAKKSTGALKEVDDMLGKAIVIAGLAGAGYYLIKKGK